MTIKMTEDTELITCILQRGVADRVVKAAMAAGAAGATMFYARGTGVRQKLGILGNFLSPEKEVVFVVTPRGETNTIFDAMVESGELSTPGRGFIFVQKVERALGFIEAD